MDHVLDNVSIQSNSGIFNIKSSRFDISIHNYLANVSLSIDFENSYASAVEANLHFHCEESVISSFSVDINGKKINSVCKTKKEAQEEYDDRISEGHFAIVQKKTSRDSFSVSLGNVNPKEKGTLILNYITELKNDDRNAVFKMPVMISHRSSTTSGKININMSSPISDIIPETNTPDKFKINKLNDHEATIEIDEINGICPIHIEIELEDPKDSEYVIEYSKKHDSNALMVSFCPDQSIFEDAEETESEIIFIVDRSGSMAGGRMRQARDALQIFMRSIPRGTYFNIISFGSSYTKMFDESVLYDESTLSKASNLIENMDSNMGGTDILLPLNYAIKLPMKDNLPRQIFLLTDGEDSSSSQILNSVRTNLNKSTRIFTFGIGADASRTLVNGIAKFGNGVAEFVNSDDSIESSVIFILNEALKGVITNVSVDWSGLNCNYSDIKINYPVLFSGQRLHSYAILNDKDLKEDSKVTLRAKIGDKDVVCECKIDFKEGQTRILENDIIHKAAANMLINALESEDSKSNKEKIIEIGIKYEVTSKYTQFIAVQERNNEEIHEIKSIDIKANKLDSDDDESCEDMIFNSIQPQLVTRSSNNSYQSSNITQSRKTKKSGGGISGFFKSLFSSSSKQQPQYDYYSQPQMQICDSSPIEQQEKLEFISCEEEKFKYYVEDDGCIDELSCPPSYSYNLSSPPPPPPPSDSSSYSYIAPSPPTKSSYSSAPRMKEKKKKQSPSSVRSKSVEVNEIKSIPSNSSPLVQLLSMADTYGKYELNSTLASLLKLSLEKIKDSVPSSLKDNIDLWASIIVLVVLELQYGQNRSKWKLSANKTTKYVNGELKKLGEKLEELMEKAKSLY